MDIMLIVSVNGPSQVSEEKRVRIRQLSYDEPRLPLGTVAAEVGIES